jgi:hypothetical protein
MECKKPSKEGACMESGGWQANQNMERQMAPNTDILYDSISSTGVGSRSKGLHPH